MRSLSDEIPFDIPDSWEWVRLGSIVYNRGQITPSTDFCYIDIGSIDNKNQKLNPTDTVIAPDKAPSRARKLVDKGDVLYSTVRPYLHNMCIVDRDFSCIPIASTGFAVLTCHAELCNKFLFYYMISPDFDAYANNTDNAKGVAYPAINDDRLYKALIPIPPLGEQFRIVSAIESVDASIRDYGAKEEALRALNGSFPERLKKSILQEAVQGKLVPQDPSDEPAEALLERIRAEKQRLIKEGKIKKDKHESVIFRRDNSHYEKLGGVERCIDDELPFEIPETWAWVRIGTILSVSSGDSLTVAQMNSAGSIPVYGGNGIAGTHDKWNVCQRTLVIGRVGYYCGATHITEPFAWVTDNAFITHFDEKLLQMKWLKFLIDYLEPRKRASSTAQPVISGKLLYPMLVPIPPLNEQHRIVQRIEELLTMVKGL